MKSKNFMKRILALALALIMMLPNNMVAFATESTDTDTAVVNEDSANTEDESAGNTDEEVNSADVPMTMSVDDESSSDPNAGIATVAEEPDGSESNPYLLEVLNGELTDGKLYEFLVSKFGTPYNGSLVKGFKYNDTYAQSSTDSDAAKYTHDDAFAVEKAYYNGWKDWGYTAAASNSKNYVKILNYYNPEIDVDAPSDVTITSDQVTLNDVEYNETHKVYENEEAVLKVTPVEGYIASITVDGTSQTLVNNQVTLVFTNSANIVVKYEKVTPATVTITTTGDGTVSGITAGEVAGGTYSLVATPGTDGYVKSILVNGTEIANDINKYSNCVFTDSITVENEKEYSVVVVFEKRELALVSSKTALSINGYDFDTRKASYISEVTVDNFVDSENCKGDGDRSFAVLMAYNRAGSTSYGTPNTIANDALAGWGTGAFDAAPAEKTLRIQWSGDNRYPTVSKDIKVDVVESRTAANITYNAIDADGAVEFDTVEEILAAVQVEGVVTTDKGTVSIDWTSDARPATDKDGEEQTAYFTATVSNSEDSLKATKEISVKVIGKVHKPTLIVTENEDKGDVVLKVGTDEVTSGSTVTAGTVIISAMPKEEGYYVKSVTVTDESNNVVTISGSDYESLEFTGSFVTVNGDYNAEKVYTVAVEYALCEIPVKADAEGKEVFFNPTKPSDSNSAIFSAIVDAEKNTEILSADCTIEFVDENGAVVEPKLGENLVVITWSDSTEKYPTVSTEAVKIILTESRKEAEISVNEVTTVVEVDGDLDAVKDDLIAAITTAGVTVPEELKDKVTYEIKAGEAAPEPGEETTVTMVISVPDSTNYLANSIEVEVPVNGKIHPSTIIVDYAGTGSGSVTLTDKDGNVINADTDYSEEFFAGTFTVTATPDSTSYVESITVKEKSDAEATDITGEYNDSEKRSNSGSFELVNENKEYTVVVTFAKRVIGTNLGTPEIKINKGKAVSAQVSEIEAAIYNAVINDNNVSQADVKSITAYGSSGIINGWYELDDRSYVIATWGDLIFNDATERVRITFAATNKLPEVTVETTISVGDSRSDAGLTNKTLSFATNTGLEFVSEDEVKAYIEANVLKDTTINPNGLDVSYALQEGNSLPEDCNETKLVTYVLTFAGNETYKPDTCEVKITVTRKAAQCTIVADSTVTANGALTSATTVDGLSKATVTVKPNSGYAVSTITVTGTTADGTPVEITDLSGITYNNRNASVTFTTAGDNGAVTYTVSATYEEVSFSANAGTITYCADQNAVTVAQLKKNVFNAVFNAEGTPSINYDAVMKDENKALKVEYSYFGILGRDLWVGVGENPPLEIGEVFRKFGQDEDGVETIKITYTDAKYGTLTATAELTVIDACYNNTVEVVEVNDKLEGTVDVSASVTPDYKTYDNVVKYKENTEYTVTVKPGNSVLQGYPTEAAHVESIVITDAAGNVVETSELGFKAASEIFGITYAEPTAYVTFTTGSSEAYKVTVTYGTTSFEVVEGDVTLPMYPGVEDVYAAEVPTAEEIFNAVITGAVPAELATYDANTMTVEYSVNGGAYSSDLAALANLADGTVINVRVTYDAGSLQYHKVSAFKDVKLVDPRTATEITGTVPTEAVEFVSDDQLAGLLTEEMGLAVNANGSALENAKIEVIVGEDYQEGENYFVDVTVSYAGTTEYKPSEVKFEKVPVLDIPDNATIKVVEEGGEGTTSVNGVVADEHILRGESAYPIVVTPNAGYAVESIVLTKDGETTKATAEGALELKYADLVATTTFTPAELTNYTITVTYSEPEFTFNETREYSFAFGVDEPVAEDIYTAAVESPALENAEGEAVIGMKYLAREAGTYTVTTPAVEVTIPLLNQAIEIPSQTVEVPFEELWVEVGTELNNDVNNIDLGAAVLSAVTNSGDILQSIISGNFDVEEILVAALKGTQLCAEEFGAGGDGSVEKIKVTYLDEKYNIAEAATDVTIVDSRAVTEIVATDATVTYGYTEADLLEAAGASVTAGGSTLDAEITVAKNFIGLSASETPYEVTLKYAGDEENRPCEKTINVTVEKATAAIDFDSQVVKYGEPYTFVLDKNPIHVDTIDFMIGIDVSDAAGNGVTPYLQIKLPGILSSVNGNMTLNQLIDLLNSFSDLGIGEDTIEQIKNVVNEITSSIGVSDIQIKVNGEMKPENIGVYLAGAVTADSNYHTAYTVDYLIVTPDGYKAELDWVINDENGIITLPPIKNGDYDLSAHVTKVYEGTVEEANALVKNLFIGVDTEGNFITTYDQNELKAGAYTEVSYIFDFGNTMYYAVPIARAFVVAPQTADVQFIGPDGQPNNDRLFTYDGEAHAMDVAVDGKKVDPKTNENLTVKYAGVQSDGELYNSEEAPSHTGTYTAIAVYSEKDENGDVQKIGMAVGAMVIAPADAQINVESKSVLYNEYDGSLGVTVNPEDCEYITMIAGVDASGDFVGEGLNALTGAVNVDFPERIDNILKKLVPSAYSDGISVNELLAQTDKIQSKLAELGLGEETINIVLDFIKNLPTTDAGNVKVTFHEAADAAPENVGLYIVGAVTFDPNYKVVSDFGYLALLPETTEVELGFNVEDDNMFITSSYIKNGLYDLGSHVKETETIDAETAKDAQQYVSNLYIGVDENGNLFMDEAPSAELGVYTQLAFIIDSGNDIYYAEPITRTYIVVPEAVNVQFEGEATEFEFTYDGTSHDVKTYAFDTLGAELPSENISVKYVGYDADGFVIYNSEEGPVNAGIYAVIATYVDTENEQYGMKIGKIIVNQAEPTVVVSNMEVMEGEDYELEISATGVNGEAVNYFTVIYGASADGKMLFNVDLPETADKLLKLVLGEDGYPGDGLTPEEIRAMVEEIKAILEKVGMDPASFDQVLEVLDMLEASGMEIVITFNETEEIKPTTPGMYNVMAVTFDPNYSITMGTGILTITSKEGMVNVTNSHDEWAEWEENLYKGEEKIAIVAIERENYYGEENEQPVIEGYVFSGWFQDEECTIPYMGAYGTYYAKFVNEDVLTAKVQVTHLSDSNPVRDLRFVTSVDSLKYDSVGFELNIGGKEMVKSTTTVYEQIRVRDTGEILNLTPKVFSPESNYFMTYRINNVPEDAYDTEITLQPFWITLDGTKVTGTSRTFIVGDIVAATIK